MAITRNLILNGPVTVPSDFMGMNLSSNTIPSNITTGNVRTQQNTNLYWLNCEQTQGVYTWTLMDAAILALRTAGATVSWAIRGTPAFYTSITTVVGGGYVGANAYPDLDTNLTATQAFITAAITRYNSPTGFFRTTYPALGKGIQIVMPVNEPRFYNASFNGVITGNTTLTVTNFSGTAIAVNGTMFVQGAGVTPGTKITAFVSGTNGGNGVYTITSSANVSLTSMNGVGTATTTYWWGTQTQTVDFMHAVNIAAKAVDSAITITSPSFGSSTAWAFPWMNIYGTIYPAVRAGTTFDLLDFHAYSSSPFGQPYCAFGYDIFGGPGGIVDYQYISSQYCGGVPVQISELGFDGGTSIPLTSLLSEQPSVRYNFLGRQLLICMALGVQRVDLFQYSQTLCGNFQANSPYAVDTTGVVAAYNSVAAVAGKTIVSGSAIFGGAVTLTFSDTTSITI